MRFVTYHALGSESAAWCLLAAARALALLPAGERAPRVARFRGGMARW